MHQWFLRIEQHVHPEAVLNCCRSTPLCTHLHGTQGRQREGGGGGGVPHGGGGGGEGGMNQMPRQFAQSQLGVDEALPGQGESSRNLARLKECDTSTTTTHSDSVQQQVEQTVH